MLPHLQNTFLYCFVFTKQYVLYSVLCVFKFEVVHFNDLFYFDCFLFSFSSLPNYKIYDDINIYES